MSPPIDPQHMDPSVPPGTDFYRYVNGRWLDANPVPPEYGAWGAFHEVHTRNEALLHELLAAAAASPADEGTPARMVGDYFAAGMDEEQIADSGTTPLQPLLDRIAAIGSVGDLADLAATLHPAGVRILFGGYVAPDFDDSTRHLLYVNQGGMGLPERDYYLRDDERSVGLREAYQRHIAAQLANLGEDPDLAARHAAAILKLETRFAEPAYTAAQLRDVELTTNKTSVSDLESLMPDFGLRRYLRSIGAGEAKQVNIDNPGFFTAVEGLLSDVPLDTLRAYCRWVLVRSTASALTPAFEDESFGFYGKMLGGQQEQKPRWKRVLAAATADIGQQVSKLYVEAAFPPQAKARCEAMVDHLLSAMGTSIRELTWMGEATKDEALAKLAGFSYKIGYPDVWRDYTGLSIDRGPFAANRLRAFEFEFNRRLAKLPEPVDEHEWEMAPHVVNAYYHPLRNEIVFPAGILQPPFFYPEADDAVNYGAIGAVIGHEITHGFDDQGSRFDAEGHLRNWWTDEDRAEFERRAAVVVEQFNGFEAAEDLNVNGELTLGENIADLGGLAIAHAALMEALAEDPRPAVDGFTPEQRFFLSYGTVWRQNATDEYLRLIVQSDPHSPARFRCNGPLANLDVFAAAFGLDDDEPMMRPEAERAHIW
jgi:predicted metalloendopeptidase